MVKLAASDGLPLVYVGINYRLGCKSCIKDPCYSAPRLCIDDSSVFGFATSEALIERRDTNAGLRDQRAALECMYLHSL